MMKPGHRQRIHEIFRAAAELPEAERAAFLHSACSGDPELRAQVERLLEEERATLPGGFPGTADSQSETPPPAADPLRPDCIGSYRILETIGEGGMGVVYLAEQEHPVRRRVAIKIIKLGMDTKEVIARFESERQALALMNHTNIARVLDAGATEQGRPYFVMEYVHGVPLTDYCDRHQLNTKERLELFIPICQAVHHAHQKGIIHRDVKPSNIMVTIEDGKPVPKVIDFGVAKATSQRLTERTLYTEHGRLIGTPEYMSPEQAEMTGLDVDTTTDIYSLGVVLYELLVGALPFDPGMLRRAGVEAMHRIIREVDPPTPSSRISTLGADVESIARRRHADPPALFRQIHGELDWITMRAMEKDRTRRYPAASELAADIQRYLHGEAVLAGPPGAAYRFKKSLRRHKALAASLAAVFAALALGLVVSTTLYVRAESARTREMKATREAKQINQFLQDMLSSVDPAEKGRETTVREVLDEAALRAEADLADQPEVQAAARSTIGNTYMALGLYAEAEPHLRAALAARQRILGPDYGDVAGSLNDLAALMREEGNLEAAELLFRDALAMDRRLHGKRDPALATTLNNLALLLKDEAKYAEAESLCRESLSMRKELFGQNHADVAISLNNLGTLLQAQGKYQEADPLLREALATRRAILKAGHPEIAASLNNLGSLLQIQGKYGEAEPLLREALAMERSLYGDQHPSVPADMSNLALALDYQGKYAEAEPLYREALSLYKRILGDEHPSIATSMNNLAVFLQARDEISEAESLQRQALAMRRRLLGNSSPEVASSLCNLASILQERGRRDEAESSYREALRIQRTVLGEDHPRVASSLLGLGSLLIDKGEASRAEPLLRRCVEIRVKCYPASAWQIAYARNVLGHCLTAQAQYAAAESLVVGSLPIIKSTASLSLKQKQRALQHAVTLYEKWGKPDRAASCQAELRSLSEAP